MNQEHMRHIGQLSRRAPYKLTQPPILCGMRNEY